jgi:predicted MFS family arabinose efflux permease
MQWMMIAFGMINCAFLVTSGRIADIFGRKKIFMLGLFSSGAGMLLAGFCSGSPGLILSMSLAGLGNAILLPVSQAMLVSEFPEIRRKHAIAIWATAVASAMAIGPLIGGIILEELGWQWVFWANIPIVLISFTLVYFFSKESKNRDDPPHIDYKGMLYIALALASFVLIATEFSRLPWVILFLLLALLLISIYLLRKNGRTHPSPILLRELVLNRIFICASIASACLILYLWALFFILPIYLQKIHHFSPLDTGLLMLGITVPVALFSPLIGKLYSPKNAWVFIAVGFFLLMLSSILQILFSASSSIPFILTTILLFGLGYSLTCSPTTIAAISVVSTQKAGIASGTFVTFQEIGGTLGLALIVSIIQVYPDLLLGINRGAIGLLVISTIGCFFGLALQKATIKR